jgi:hypothetical protein
MLLDKAEGMSTRGLVGSLSGMGGSLLANVRAWGTADTMPADCITYADKMQRVLLRRLIFLWRGDAVSGHGQESQRSAPTDKA